MDNMGFRGVFGLGRVVGSFFTIIFARILLQRKQFKLKALNSSDAIYKYLYDCNILCHFLGNLGMLSSSLFPTSCEHQFIDIHTGKVWSISISIIEIDFFAKDFHFATFMPWSMFTWTSVSFLAVINIARNNFFKLIFDFYDIPLIPYSQQGGRFMWSQ